MAMGPLRQHRFYGRLLFAWSCSPGVWFTVRFTAHVTVHLPMRSLDKILHNWDQQAALASFSRNRDMGTAWGKPSMTFLTHGSVQATQFCNVQTYGAATPAMANC